MKALQQMRIVIADDSDEYREALIHAISNYPQLIVVGAAKNGAELIEMCDSTAPDIAMTDIRMPIIDGLSAIKKISKNHPKTLLVAFSTANTAPIKQEAIMAGAHIFFSKDQTMVALQGIYENYKIEMSQRPEEKQPE